MKSVSVAEAKNTLPELIHAAEKEAVGITRRGRAVAVLLSETEYQRLRRAAAAGFDFAGWASSWRSQLPAGFDGVTQDELGRWLEG